MSRADNVKKMIHRVLRAHRTERGKEPHLVHEGDIERSWSMGGVCERAEGGEEEEKVRHQMLKDLVHQISSSDLHLPLYFSRLGYPGVAHIPSPLDK